MRLVSSPKSYCKASSLYAVCRHDTGRIRFPVRPRRLSGQGTRSESLPGICSLLLAVLIGMVPLSRSASVGAEEKAASVALPVKNEAEKNVRDKTAGQPAAKSSAKSSVGKAEEVTASSWSSFRNGFDLLGIAQSPLPGKLELLWKYPTGEMVVATSAIVDGRVYVASLNGVVTCLNLKNGQKIWNYRSIDDPDPKAFAPGFKASPTVSADAVIVGDEDGVLHCINRDSGKVRWTFKTGAEIVSSASLYQDKVIFGSHDNSLYCLQQADGKEVWKFETQGPVNCTPAIVGRQTFVTGCDEHLRVINIDTGKEETDIHLGTYLIASPAVVDETLYVGTYASEVVAVDWKNKKDVTWRFKDAERDFPYHSCAAITPDLVIVGGRDKRVHCLNRATGKQVWHFDAKGKVDSSPVVVGKRVFVGSEDGNLYELDLAKGTELWRFNAGKSISASPAVAEGCLVIGSESSDGFVYCFGSKSTQ